MAYDTLFEEGIYVDVVSGATEIHFFRQLSKKSIADSADFSCNSSAAVLG